MTSVMSGGFGGSSSSSSNSGGTEFMSTLSPLKEKLDGYDNTKPCSKQTIPISHLFCEAMAVREEVYGEQGVPLEAEFDEDDARSWHFIAYASVATTTSRPPRDMRADAPSTPADDARRSSASASRMAVATIRLIPPPHGPNKYIEDSKKADKHADADPPSEDITKSHPVEPYIKLGRLATLKPYRKMGLASLLINAAFAFAKQNPDTIYKPPSPRDMEKAQIKGHGKEQQLAWDGLVMIHAQASLQKMWEKQGFSEELRDENGEVEVAAEPHWMEEGIEHVGMWKRLDVKRGRSALNSSM